MTSYLDLSLFCLEDIPLEGYTLESDDNWSAIIEDRFGYELPGLSVDARLFAQEDKGYAQLLSRQNNTCTGLFINIIISSLYSSNFYYYCKFCEILTIFFCRSFVIDKQLTHKIKTNIINVNLACISNMKLRKTNRMKLQHHYCVRFSQRK